MKSLKKVLTVLFAAIMTLAMSMVAFAANEVPKTNIEIIGGTDGAVYNAYRILNSTDGGDGKYAYSFRAEEAYKNAVKAGIEAVHATRGAAEDTAYKTTMTDGEMIDYISKLSGNAEKIGEVRTFVDAAYKSLVAAKVVKDGAVTYAEDTHTIANVEQGYYIVAQVSLPADSKDAVSLVMLDTAGKDKVTINTKVSKPTVEKKVKETNDTTGNVTEWQDGADYDVNDWVPFKLTGSLPADLSAYDNYKYSFVDTLSAGLTYPTADVDAAHKVKVLLDSENGTDITESFEIKAVKNDDKTTTLTIACNNVKAIEGVTASSRIIVLYDAQLNTDAVIGANGNPNAVKLEYSNNPYKSGDGSSDDKPNDTTETPEDHVIVFTYKVLVNKVDKNGAPLEGAGFTLYKVVPSTDGKVKVGSEIKGDGITSFEFSKLDAGKYVLEETSVPHGYNKAADLEFEVISIYTADLGHNTEAPSLIRLEIKDKNGDIVSTSNEEDKDDEGVLFFIDQQKNASTKVVNLSGAELPSTGGMGTTLFYVLGAVLVLGAGVVLVSKRRMA